MDMELSNVTYFQTCGISGTAEATNFKFHTRNSSGDEIANVNFLYDDIVHAVKIQ